jgi:hypothetical protein
MLVMMVLTVDIPNSVIDQLNNKVGQASNDLNSNNKKMIDFLDEIYKKSISNKIRKKK